MWQEKDKQLYRQFKFKNFDQAFEFMRSVAEVAASLDHHPKWTNDYNKVQIWLTTHSAGKVTQKDRDLASRINRVYEQMISTPNEPKLAQAKLYTDGGARGNPGPAACAFVICNLNDNVVKKYGFYAGRATNNLAEYQALIAGLEAVGKLGVRRLQVFMDSELIVRQLNGQYKIKNQDLRPLFNKAKVLTDGFESVSFTHVPRNLNKEADKEVNRILDERL